MPDFIPFLPIEQHGVIGNRRTAAMVAADGTIDWLCLPHYDGTIPFGSLLDGGAGFCRFGSRTPLSGKQRYVERSPVLVTSWCTPGGELELTDFMTSPERDGDHRPLGHALVRRLRCLHGEADCRFVMRACYEFNLPAAASQQPAGTVLFDLDQLEMGLWATFPIELRGAEAQARFTLQEDERRYLVLQIGEPVGAWSDEAAEQALARVLGYWREWQGRLSCSGPREDAVRRSATTIHLLGYVPAGSSVAAPTSSLPERIGGIRNYDYRYAWVRDASLSASSLAMLGDTDTAAHYMDWLASLDSSADAPLQVCYNVDGSTDVAEHQRDDVYGYRGSLPFRIGNHAYRQRQLGYFGFLADCALIYLQHGGKWQPEYWDLIWRSADYVLRTWREEDHGIWELDTQTHHVSSKAMCWVTLDRAIALARMLGRPDDLSAWEQAAERIKAEVLRRGWSPRLQAFRQSYGADTLDASTLLIPLMGLLPVEDARVRSTVERIEQSLMLNGYLYRFDPEETEGVQALPLGEFEGAFLPSTFMLAGVYAQAGQLKEAEELLDRVERAAGDLGLFPEEIDARDGSFLGNAPLLFSHAEHVRAVVSLAARG